MNLEAHTITPAPTSHTLVATPAPTPKKTYAEATTNTPSTLKRPTVTGTPRTHHNKIGTKPAPPRRSDFGQLTVYFNNCHQTESRRI